MRLTFSHFNVEENARLSDVVGNIWLFYSPPKHETVSTVILSTDVPQLLFVRIIKSANSRVERLGIAKYSKRTQLKGLYAQKQMFYHYLHTLKQIFIVLMFITCGTSIYVVKDCYYVVCRSCSLSF